MNMKLSKRETVMVVILALVVIGVCYFKLYYTPVSEEIASYQIQSDEVQTTIDTNLIIAADKQRMQNFIDEKKSDGETHAIPFFDNSINLMNDLNGVLNSTDSFSLNFGETTADDYLVRRPVTLTFTTDNYTRARDIIDRLGESDNVNQIGDMSVSISEEEVSVNLSITYYEVQP